MSAAGVDGPPDAPVVVLVDGSNVAHSEAWRTATNVEDQHDRNQRLTDAVCGWAAGERRKVTVIFDGVGPFQRGSRQITPQVEVVGTGPEEGDAVLERRAAEQRRLGATHWIVSSDNPVRQTAGSGAERVISAADFVALLGVAGEGGADSRSTAFSRPDPTRLVEAIDADIRAQLEQLRRGDLPPS